MKPYITVQGFGPEAIVRDHASKKAAHTYADLVLRAGGDVAVYSKADALKHGLDPRVPRQ